MYLPPSVLIGSKQQYKLRRSIDIVLRIVAQNVPYIWEWVPIDTVIAIYLRTRFNWYGDHHISENEFQLIQWSPNVWEWVSTDTVITIYLRMSLIWCSNLHISENEFQSIQWSLYIWKWVSTDTMIAIYLRMSFNGYSDRHISENEFQCTDHHISGNVFQSIQGSLYIWEWLSIDTAIIYH